GIQLDEVAFPILLAWHLWKKAALRDFDPYSMIRSAAAYLVRHGPATQQERWEEDSGYSPSTLAVSIAALVCAADFIRVGGKQEEAIFLLDYADFLESHIESWTVTSDGSLVPGINRHCIRIHPAAIDDVSPDEDPITDCLPSISALRGSNRSSRQRTSRMAVSSSWFGTVFASQAI